MSTSNRRWSASGVARCAYAPHPAPGPRPPVGKVSPRGLGRVIRATSSTCEGGHAPRPTARAELEAGTRQRANYGRERQNDHGRGLHPVTRFITPVRTLVPPYHRHAFRRSVRDDVARLGARPLQAQREGNVGTRECDERRGRWSVRRSGRGFSDTRASNRVDPIPASDRDGLCERTNGPRRQVVARQFPRALDAILPSRFTTPRVLHRRAACAFSPVFSAANRLDYGGRVGLPRAQDEGRPARSLRDDQS